MSSLTAIELGADTCAVARTSVRRGEIRVFAAEVLDPRQFPGSDALATALRQSRRTLRLPRRSRVVVWGLPDGTARYDPSVAPVLRPLLQAGFKIERVVSPCNALAALARLKTARGDGATCWIAVNRGGVAIVVVRPGRQIYAHSFAWDSSIGSTGSQARMLQRYSLVSSLAPQVKRAMAAALEQDTRVEAIVTCGNLPDLRSLTMPLIEELDVEVETLDSLDGLEVAPGAVDRVAEIAPAIRLACAGTIARGARPWDDRKRRRHHAARWLRAAAVIAALGAAAYAWWVWYPKWTAQRVTARARIESRDSRLRDPAAAPRPPVIEPRTARPVTPRSEPPRTPPVTPRSDLPRIPAIEPRTPPPVKPDVAPRPSIPAPRTAAPVAPRSEPPRTPAIEARTPPPHPQPAPRASVPDPTSAMEPRPQLPPVLNTPSIPTDKVEAAPARPRPMPPLLTDPVPRLTAILVSNDRRYATVDDGRIVGVGDTIGRRIVVGIDERTMLLREPSGVQIRVGLGGRIVAIERQDR